MNYTKEQEQAIFLRDKNIMVSAGAGAGKTRVLVSRMAELIMDEKNPVEADRFLVMTFTNAAAAEMKERISLDLEERLAKDPENHYLRKQIRKIRQADISTVHSFCNHLIRTHYNELSIDPSFRIGEEGELFLLRQQAIEQLLEEAYASGRESFVKFAESYAPGKSDKVLEELVGDLYRFSRSFPNASFWFEKTKQEALQLAEAKEWDNSPAVMLIFLKAKKELLQEKEALSKLLKNIAGEEVPEKYGVLLQDVSEYVEALSQTESYDAYYMVLSRGSVPAFPRATKKDKEWADYEIVKEWHQEVKELLQKQKETVFTAPAEELQREAAGIYPLLEEYIVLAQRFEEIYLAYKKEKNVYDFDDLEHFALELLVDHYDKGGQAYPSETAKTLAKKYKMIFVDEYQDTNLVQETILEMLSEKDNNTLFTVGDVKQSIYRFRLARPELFMEKYKSYSLEDSPEQRIDLHKNFRSRPEVLESVNFIFRQIMGEDLGGIAYDEAAALYPGASFPEGQDPEFVKTEILLVDKYSPLLEEEDEEVTENERELEALAIAGRIRSMVGHERVLDKETGEYRPLQYGDIVILLRSASGWAETFGEVLSARGIPVYTASRTGYFSATEVVTLLNYLRILDNPLQDIPMTGVLRSPIVGCTTEELAELRIAYPEGMIYECVCRFVEDYRKHGSSEENKKILGEKLSCFMDTMNTLRDKAAYTPVHQLILEVLARTGYGDHAKAMPNGEQRNANLNMLVEKAMEYEKTSYRGLFNFVRYIQKLQQYQVDYGEVNLSGTGESAVQIMTIHKSKGLEFPVVFAAGMGKRFNFRDMNASILIHPELGIGADAILPEKRIIAPSLCKQIIRRALLMESLGEELRVLYVALTRAKEKLILSGTIGALQPELGELSALRDSEEPLLSLGRRLGGKTYWDYVLPALARHRCMAPLFHEYGIFMNTANPLYKDPAEFKVTRVTARELTESEVVEQAEREMKKETLENWNPGRVFDSEIREEIQRRFSFVYPYQYLEDLPVKVSVSELKKRSYHSEQDLEETVDYETEEEIQPLVPRFIEEKKAEGYTGALRGTAYHRVMECLDYQKTANRDEIRRQLREWVDARKMERKEAESVRVKDIWNFVETPLGQRMKAASEKRLLFREQPFVIARKASELDPQWQCEENVLVQGIIDAYFIEDEEIVLVDYKTDFVRRGEEQKLIDRYHVQLEDYAQALERMTGRKVKERYIYSFTLGEAFSL